MFAFRSRSRIFNAHLFKGSIMPDSQSRRSVSLPAIERPACPICQAQMMLVRIMPAFRGTDLHTFECADCDYVLNTLVVGDVPRSPRDFGTRHRACGRPTEMPLNRE
jgi:hypothetical protein